MIKFALCLTSFMIGSSLMATSTFEERLKAFDEIAKKEGQYLTSEELASVLNAAMGQMKKELPPFFGTTKKDYVVCYQKKEADFHTIVAPYKNMRTKIDLKKNYKGSKRKGAFSGHHLHAVVDHFFKNPGTIVKYGLGTEKEAHVIAINDSTVCALVHDSKKKAKNLNQETDSALLIETPAS